MKKFLLLQMALLVSSAVFCQSKDQASPVPQSYSPLLPPLCGSYNVGAGQTYTTLTAAIADLNTRGVSCPVIFLLTDNTYSSETFPITIGAVAGTSFTNTVTIKPGPGKTPAISGSSTTAILILNGSKYVIIDGSNSGGSDKSLTWANTSTAANTYGIELMNPGAVPSSNDIIKNCLIRASSQLTKNTYGIFLDNTNGAYDSITISNNTIYSARIGIQFQGAAGAVATNGQILNNIIGSVTDAQAIQFKGIFLRLADNTLIQGNEIMGASLGNANNTQAGIWIPGNVANTRILQNKIHDWYYTGSSGYGNYGIYYGAGAATPTEISNNVITSIKSDGDVSSQDWITAGIYINSGGNIRILHNSIWLTGAVLQPTYTGVSACLSIYSGITSLNVRDNIFKNSQTLASGTTGNTYAVYCASANTAFGNINFNDYYVDGVNPNIGFLGSNRATLANWQTATGQDANSLNIDPLFTGVNDLHTTVSGLAKAGVYIALVQVDITGAGRTNPPDIGAYQFSAPQVVNSAAANGITSTTAILNGNITANNATVTSGFEYGLTTAYGTGVAGVPPTVTGVTLTNISAAISGLTGNTLYHYRARGLSGGLVVNGGDLTFTTSGNPPTVTTTAANGISGTGATVNGIVNANGSSTTVSFDYGVTLAYGSNVAGVPSPVTGGANTNVSAVLTGLLPNTLYHFRVNGTNAGGTANGSDLTFTTSTIPPTAVTTAATGVGPTLATLNGTVTANNLSTNVSFDYGLTIAYGTNVPAVPVTVTGMVPTNVSANLTGLAGSTTYHFRVNAVNGAGTTLGNDLTFTTGCPVAGPAGPITGPVQVCQGGCGYVYSVTPIANASGYVWTIPVGGSITAGANTNSITVCYAANAFPGYVMVYGTAACGNGSPSQLAVGMNAPANPVITGPASVCVNSSGNVYTTQAGMTNYTWSVSAGGTITAGGTPASNTVTVTWNTTGAKTVCVNYNNAAGCPALAPVCYNVTVNPLPVPVITGPNPACTNLPGIIYSTQPGMTSYTWSVSAGGTITAGPGTNAITVNWTVPGAQTVSVNYVNGNGCTASAPTVYPVTVNATTIPVITGSGSLCVNSGYYNYSTQSGMTNYLWTITSGGTITYGMGTNTIQVVWNTPGAQTVSVNFTNPGGCTPVSSTVFPVTVNPIPDAAGTITGTSTVCAGASGIAYSVSPINNAISYVWTLPAGATIASGAGTNAITVDFANNTAPGNITVNGNNLCGNGTVSPPYPVTLNPLPDAAGTISGESAVCAGTTGVIYSILPVANATGYVWAVPAGITIVGGSNTNSITVDIDLSASGGNITVYGTNDCGQGLVSPIFALIVNPVPDAPVITMVAITLSSNEPTGNQWYYEGILIPGATNSTYDPLQSGWYWDVVTQEGCSSDTSNHLFVIIEGTPSTAPGEISVYPVPNDGQFSVSISSQSDKAFTISIYNNLGVQILATEPFTIFGNIQKVIDLRATPSGIYSLMLRSEGKVIIKRIIVNK